MKICKVASCLTEVMTIETGTMAEIVIIIIAVMIEMTESMILCVDMINTITEAT